MNAEIDILIIACFESGNIFSDECDVIRERLKASKDKILISRKTAITSITGLRHFNRKLEEDAERYGSDPNYISSYHSVLNFKDLVKKAYTELQEETGDRTPIDI